MNIFVFSLNIQLLNVSVHFSNGSQLINMQNLRISLNLSLTYHFRLPHKFFFYRNLFDFSNNSLSLNACQKFYYFLHFTNAVKALVAEKLQHWNFSHTKSFECINQQFLITCVCHYSWPDFSIYRSNLKQTNKVRINMQ